MPSQPFSVVEIDQQQTTLENGAGAHTIGGNSQQKLA
jgi:hypothetical protein